MSFEIFLIIFAVFTFTSTYGILFGGGGLLALPVLFLLRFDPKVVIATSLTTTIIQLIIGTIRFHKHRKINWFVARQISPAFAIGGMIGIVLFVNIDGLLIKKIVSLVIIIFAILSLIKHKTRSHRSKPSLLKKIIANISIFFLGIYQTTIIAGAGTVSIFILMHSYGLNLKKAIGTKQLIQIPPIAIASIAFISQGLVDWVLVLPIISGRIIGSIIGAEIMVKSKGEVLSSIFNIVVILLAIRVLLF